MNPGLEKWFQDSLRKNDYDVDLALEDIRGLLPESFEKFLPIAQACRDEMQRNRILTLATPAQHNRLAGEDFWYPGPSSGDTTWQHLLGRLRSSLPETAVASIDSSSTEIVANLACPGRPGKVKGLVVGHVQSGKTANYASVIAKAADAGYRLVIVLAGMHNNLRRQTQERLVEDLDADNTWVQITDAEADFGRTTLRAGVVQEPTIGVVKKNVSRLRRLNTWLEDAGAALRNCPILIIDDEADQATPNTATRDKLSGINREVRRLWSLVQRGSYVAYTATPFANVFMDPDDDGELYPANFIRQLPVSADYFGAARLFGSPRPDNAEDPDDGLDVSRSIPAPEAEELRVPANERFTWQATMVPSLVEAARWFLIATAIRWCRSGAGHSSMLVHFTHFAHPHEVMAEELELWVREERRDLHNGGMGRYRNLWESEHDRVPSSNEAIPWEAVSQKLPEVLEAVTVIVDNGLSENRLVYGDAEDAPQTVIVVGGGTLSRGLTLEGLVVSYFTRTSNTYDTLLQMGRWFGYRPGYEDLPRVWVMDELREDFQFLASVEDDLRRTIDDMNQQSKTPAEIGVKVKGHPGRLQITSRAKMQHADLVQASLSGEVQQTFILDETDKEKIIANLSAARELVGEIGAERFTVAQRGGGNRLAATGVNHRSVARFLHSYRPHGPFGAPDSRMVLDWFTRVCPDPLWNVAIVAGPRGAERSVDLGLAEAVRCVTRRPLRQRPLGEANIKALISQPDIVTDLPAGPDETGQNGKPNYKLHRAIHAPGIPLLLLYPIDGQASAPRDGADQYYRTRRSMQAPDGLSLIGYAVCFPTVTSEDFTTSAEYFAVSPSTWAPESPEEIEAEVLDADEWAEL